MKRLLTALFIFILSLSVTLALVSCSGGDFSGQNGNGTDGEGNIADGGDVPDGSHDDEANKEDSPENEDKGEGVPDADTGKGEENQEGECNEPDDNEPEQLPEIKPSIETFVRCDKNGTPDATGGYLLFGEYPRSLKAADVTITSATDSRGYYLGSDGYYYACVTAQPYDAAYTFACGEQIVHGEVCYFKVEPIRWRILSEDGASALILCDSIIDNRPYQSDYYCDYSKNEYYTEANGAPEGTYANNYKYSEIRAWLNGQFYETAFTQLQRDLIRLTTVDNSAQGTNSSDSLVACENTEDRLFLLSYAEAISGDCGFLPGNADDEVKRMLTTDYSRAVGVWMRSESDYYGYGQWWLRSPYWNVQFNKYNVCRISFKGDAEGWNDALLGSGVLPALYITL